MDVSKMALLFAAGQPAAAGDPPTGDPTTLTLATYGGTNKLRLQWVNADPTAYTRVYREFSTCPVTSPTLIGSANPGVTSFDTTIEVVRPIVTFDISFVVRHYKNGQESGDSNCRSDDAVTVPE